MRRQCTRALLALLLLAPGAHANEWNLDTLLQRFAAVKSARAAFTEEKISALLNAPLRLRGELAYTAPAHLEKIVVTPVRERLIADGDRLRLERTLANGGISTHRLTLDDHPLLRPLIAGVRATLAGDGATLARHYVVALSGSEQAWDLHLLPRDATVRATIVRVRLQGHGPQIREIEIDEASGDRSHMRLRPLP